MTKQICWHLCVTAARLFRRLSLDTASEPPIVAFRLRIGNSLVLSDSLSLPDKALQFSLSLSSLQELNTSSKVQSATDGNGNSGDDKRMGENKSETSWRWDVPAIVTVDQGNYSVVKFRCRGCKATGIFESVATLFVLPSVLEATIVRELNLDESLIIPTVKHTIRFHIRVMATLIRVVAFPVLTHVCRWAISGSRGHHRRTIIRAVSCPI
ncbi:hypothetical protein EUGRSUZ_G00725 [Eucalyptus grandis]|uniref:Uncharacterized protein n=2 Tax=Eucalyptus grandis TaxID=71139 RepID=A0ACC3K1V6_EUCGR|nr:hypothetical protein EUGRSUZ_G00725 [Eucalyptus grandis]